MDDYDLCVLSTHGAYYTYTTGWLFKQVRTAPVLLLREESSFWDDLRYGFDLLTHRVIKVNGDYCITPDFFAARRLLHHPRLFCGGLPRRPAGGHHGLFRDL